METLTIDLAGQKFNIQPFTVGQLQDLHVGAIELLPEDPVENTRKFWDRNIAILVSALCVDHPNINADVIRKMRLGTITAVNSTVREIMFFSGIWTKQESKSGEDPAATE